MSKSSSFACLAIAGAALSFATGSAHAIPAACSGPSVGYDTAGPQLCILLNADGTASVVNGPSAGFGPANGAYDGIEDAYIGVVNNTSSTVNAITLSSSSEDIFGFDGDGIGVGPYTNPLGSTSQYGTPNGSDPSGYGGPNGFFTNIQRSVFPETGTLNFIGGLAAGGSTYFSLEENLDSASFTAQVGTTPAPAALPLLASGLGSLGLFGWWRRRKSSASA